MDATALTTEQASTDERSPETVMATAVPSVTTTNATAETTRLGTRISTEVVTAVSTKIDATIDVQVDTSETTVEALPREIAATTEEETDPASASAHRLAATRAQSPSLQMCKLSVTSSS